MAFMAAHSGSSAALKESSAASEALGVTVRVARDRSQLRRPPVGPSIRKTGAASVQGFVAFVGQVAGERHALLGRLRAACEKNDLKEIRLLARQLVGLEEPDDAAR
jgi:hypothetical protein